MFYGLDTSSDAWTNWGLTNVTIAGAGWFFPSSLVRIGDTMLVFGPGLLAYDLATQVWTNVTALGVVGPSFPRGSHAFAAQGSRFYISVCAPLLLELRLC